MVELNFENGYPNPSIAIGDMVFYISSMDTNINQSGFISGDSQSSQSEGAQSQLMYIGNVVEINDSSAPTSFTIYVENTSTITAPLTNDYILFSKNNMASSDLLGYYNKVTFKNDSPDPAEIFAISLNYTESSK